MNSPSPYTVAQRKRWERNAAWQKEAASSGCLSNCLNCAFWNRPPVQANGVPPRPSTGCKLAGDAVPPPEVIVVGCPSWEEDIPF